MTPDSVIGLAGGTLSIFATFLIVAAAITGVGLWLRSAFDGEALNEDDCLLAFWTGFSLVTLLLIVWNFVLPVGLAALTCVLVAGGLGIVRNRRALGALLGSEAWRQRLGEAVALMAVGLWVANQATAGFQSFDGGLYHIQSVFWARAFPAVPGIANLHGPLAFNNASFLYDAMLDAGPWADRSFHIANGVLVFMLALQAIVAGARFVRGGRSATAANLFSFLLLAPALSFVRNGDLPSYSTDIPATALLLVAAATFYRQLDEDVVHSSPTAGSYQLVALSTLLSAAVCVKLSVAVFAAVAAPLSVWLWWRTGGRLQRHRRTTVVWAMLIPVVFAIPWMARGVVLSGYPLFPLPIAGFPVDWRAPVEHARAELAFIGYTERGFSWHLVGRGWVRNVLVTNVYAVLVPCATAFFALLFLWKSTRRAYVPARRATWWLLLPAAVAIAYWLISAPSTRYSVALFWTIAILCLCEWWNASSHSFAAVGTRRFAVGMLLLGISPPIVEPTLTALHNGSNPLVAVATHNLIGPGPDRWLHPMTEHAEVTPYQTRSGLWLNVPRKPADADGTFAKSWDAPIPCTPNPAPNLRLRQPGRLDKGFTVDGEWQMEDWPYYWDPSFLVEWRRRTGQSAIGATAANAPSALASR